MGQEIPQDFQVLAGQLSQSEHLFQVPGGGPATDLHDQRHRGLQPPAAEGDQIQVGLPDGRQPAENVVPGDDRHHGQMDGTAAGLGKNPRPAGYLLRRSTARLT